MTGSRQGIGRGIVEAYRREGAAVTTCGRGPRPDGLSDSVIWYPLGVTDADAVEELAHATDGTEILVNNAGVQAEKTVSDSTDADWNAVIGTNCRGVFNMCRAFIPQMSEGGSIINIGSVSGQVADPAMALYIASKAFVHGLTRSIAVDHGPKIHCNAICPGWIETGMLDAGFDLAATPRPRGAARWPDTPHAGLAGPKTSPAQRLDGGLSPQSGAILMEFAHTACPGDGTIGASWAALFLASGRSVAMFDPGPDVEHKVRAYIETAWPKMTELGLTARGTPDAITFHTSAARAVEGAAFAQENAPERPPINHAHRRWRG